MRSEAINCSACREQRRIHGSGQQCGLVDCDDIVCISIQAGRVIEVVGRQINAVTIDAKLGVISKVITAVCVCIDRVGIEAVQDVICLRYAKQKCVGCPALRNTNGRNEVAATRGIEDLARVGEVVTRLKIVCPETSIRLRLF